VIYFKIFQKGIRKEFTKKTFFSFSFSDAMHHHCNSLDISCSCHTNDTTAKGAAPKSSPCLCFRIVCIAWKMRKQARVIVFSRLLSLLLIFQQCLNVILIYSSYNVGTGSESLRVNTMQYGFRLDCNRTQTIISGKLTDMTSDIQPALTFFLVLLILKFWQWIGVLVLDRLCYVQTCEHLKSHGNTMDWKTDIKPYAKHNRYDIIALDLFYYAFTLCNFVLPVIVYYMHGQGNATSSANPWNTPCSQGFIPDTHSAKQLFDPTCMDRFPKTWYRLSYVCIRAIELVAGSVTAYQKVIYLQDLLWKSTLFSLAATSMGLLANLVDIGFPLSTP
jgi:hypothetical protein